MAAHVHYLAPSSHRFDTSRALLPWPLMTCDCLPHQVRHLSSLGHPNIIQYLACFVDMPREVLCIVTELAAGGTLKRAIACQAQLGRPFPSFSIVNWVEQLRSALAAIHSQLIIHRDIKPANIFLTKDADLKLGDFGLSRRTPHSGAMGHAIDLATTACGTPYYMSPERFQAGGGYSTPADLWSVGCVLYEMLTLTKCFAASSFAELCTKIEQGDLT